MIWSNGARSTDRAVSSPRRWQSHCMTICLTNKSARPRGIETHGARLFVDSEILTKKSGYRSPVQIQTLWISDFRFAKNRTQWSSSRQFKRTNELSPMSLSSVTSTLLPHISGVSGHFWAWMVATAFELDESMSTYRKHSTRLCIYLSGDYGRLYA